MKQKGIVPDQDTFVHFMKACQHKGDIKAAYNALIDMKELNFPVFYFYLIQDE